MKKTVPIILIIIGVLVLIIALIIPIIFPTIYDKQLSAKLIIRPESEMLEKFTNPPATVYFKTYLFNIKNPDDVLDYGEKPILEQLGPYVYRYVKRKIDLNFNHENGTLKYRVKKYFFFEPKMSNGSEDDRVTTVNPVFMSLAAKSQAKSGAMQALANMIFLTYETDALMTKSVKEILFGGYEDDIIKFLYNMTKEEKFESGKTGYLYPKNGSVGEVVEISTGELGMSDYQNIHSYGGMEELPYWRTEYCNMINGTDGTQFPRPVNKNQTLYFYVPDLCRSLYAKYEKDVFLGPLKLHRFLLSFGSLAFGPENDCYCSSEFTCRQSMIDTSPCRDGSPIVMSTPHFYKGMDKDINEIEGLHPIKEDHETILDVEPNTGVTIRAKKRIQINIAFRKYDTYELDFAPEVIMPIMWFSEQGEAPLATAEALYVKLESPQKVAHYGAWGLFIVGAILVLVGAIMMFVINRKSKNAKKIQSKSPDENGVEVKGLLNQK